MFWSKTNLVDTTATDNSFAYGFVYTRANTASRTHYERDVGHGDVTIDMYAFKQSISPYY